MPDGADKPIGWRSTPIAPIRNLFAATRRAELGPLNRLPRAHASVSKFRLTTVKDGFGGSSSFCSWPSAATRRSSGCTVAATGRSHAAPSDRSAAGGDAADVGGGSGGVGGCAVQMAQPCHHNVCPMPNEAGTCKGVRLAIRLENTPQTLQPSGLRRMTAACLRRGNASAPLPHVLAAGRVAAKRHRAMPLAVSFRHRPARAATEPQS